MVGKGKPLLVVPCNCSIRIFTCNVFQRNKNEYSLIISCKNIKTSMFGILAFILDKEL